MALNWDVTCGAEKSMGGIASVTGVDATWASAWLSRPGVRSAPGRLCEQQMCPRPPGRLRKEWRPRAGLWAASPARGQAARERRAESAGRRDWNFPRPGLLP